MLVIYALLLVLAFLCFLISAAQQAGAARLLAAGLALWVAVPLLEALRSL